MDEDYDIIILGTGLKECILSGILSVKKYKVLQLDRNDYYGSESASLDLNELYKKFKMDFPPPEEYGNPHFFIVDLCPKFLMACGSLVKMLLYTRVHRYLDFRVVDGSYVYRSKKLYKVPSTPSEALNSGLMGFFQKRKLRNFLNWVEAFNEQKEDDTLVQNPTIRKLFAAFGIDQNTASSIGHALALQNDDSYLDDPNKTIKFIKAVKVYAYSVQKYGKSPFIYPLYALSGLPEGFARLAAVHGGVFMLNKDPEILYDKNDKVRGIHVDGKEARCKMLLADPSYFPKDCSKQKGRVARKIFLMKHPLEQTQNARSCQVIIPGAEIGRKSDVYIAVVSWKHKVTPKNMFIAMASTHVETEYPEKELDGAVKSFVGEVEKEFFFTTDFLVPTEEFESNKDGTFMTRSYDATTHFETVSNEVLEVYEKMTGEKFDLSTIHAEPKDVQNKE